MNSKTLRSLSLSVISLAGQFGVRITVEQLEKKISQGQIKSEKESSCIPIFEELFVSLATNPSKKSKIQAININKNAIK